MAETKPRQRVFALVIAVLFFVFTFAASFGVIWQLIQDNRKAKATTDTTNTSQTADNTPKSSGDKLQGTKLANFTPTDSIPSLQTQDVKVGTGAEAKTGDTVTADYTGAVAATGVIFQSSLDSGAPVPFDLGQVIDGWKQGIPGMKVGGERRLLIPAAMAYGANPPSGSGIPANADLVFDVTLHAVK